ncbi:protein RAE1-like [Malus domestica]|uniref:protein RAE1-like n=1 Tax=Malus domestica TaxID=3750 RepID=UPI00397673CE
MSNFMAASNQNQNPNKSFEVTHPPNDSISSLSFSPKSNILVATSWDNQVKMWPLAGNQPVTVAMHDAPIKEAAWIPEMNYLVTGSWDKT